MPRKQRLTWTVVLRLAVVVTAFASLVVLGGGTALLLVEGERGTLAILHVTADASLAVLIDQGAALGLALHAARTAAAARSAPR